MVTVQYPSKIKIRINQINDSEGNPVDFGTVRLVFNISDQNGGQYECVWDPFNAENNKNTVVSDSKLVLLLAGYSLSGPLSWRFGTGVEDSDFQDGVFDNWTDWSPVGITISNGPSVNSLV